MTCFVFISRCSLNARRNSKPNLIGAAAMAFCVRAHRDFKLRRRQSIIQSLQSAAAISSIRFYWRNFTTLGCVHLLVLSVPVARHFDLCDSEDISTLTGKE